MGEADPARAGPRTARRGAQPLAPRARARLPARAAPARAAGDTEITRLSLRGRRLLWLIVGAGTLARLAIAAVTGTSWIDLESFGIVNRTLDDGLLDFYGNLADEDRWPYPPGYLPVVLGADGLASLTGIGFERLIRLVPIAADAGVALVVAHLVGVRGASERTRLTGAALVAFGPVFAGVSAFQGQIDAVAILPALAALAVWEQGGERRALAAGLLIGAGTAVKSVPLLMLLALVPAVRSRREALTLVGAAVAVPLAALAPFLLKDAGDVVEHLSYRGFAGLGGLSLLVQPDFPAAAITKEGLPQNGALDLLIDAGGAIVAVALAAVAALVVARRPPPVEAAVVVWLTPLVFGVNFFLQYLVWALPFLIVAAGMRRAAAIQLLALPALIVFYAQPGSEALVWALYTAPVLALWVLLAITLAGRVRTAWAKTS